MPEDLPLYPDSMLRTRLQFSDVERFRTIDSSHIWVRADSYIEQMEAGTNVAEARRVAAQLSRSAVVAIHGIVFHGRENAGRLRQKTAIALYRGQDCPDPEFIERSLENLANWLTAESLAEIHPIEKAALVLTRIVDIWPFEYGNLTVAIIMANEFLRQGGFSPFFVLPQHMKEFNTVIAQAVSIETQPLVNAIHKTIKREMEEGGSR